MIRVAACAALFLAFVHGVEYSVETTADGQVRIGGFYSGGGPMVDATLVVTRTSGDEAARDKTDKDGFVRLRLEPGDYAFRIDDGAGHRIDERFTLRAHQLDGRVRDLIDEAGREPTALERVRAMPKWLTATIGLGVIVALFALLRRLRSSSA